MEIISHYIGKWGLPNEEIPFHIIWQDRGDSDRVEVELPKGVEVVELFNVQEADIGEKLTVKKTMTSGYFGGVVSFREAQRDKLSKKEIRINFLKKDEVVFSQDLVTHIIRPQIRIVEAPKLIEISDNLTRGEINNLIALKVRHEGFGQTKIKIEVRTKGEIVSRGRSLHLDVIRKLIKIEPHRRNVIDKATPEEADAELSVEKESLEEFVEEIESMVGKGEVPIDDVTEDELKEFVLWLKESRKKDEWLRVLYSYVESYLIETLLSSLKRHPAEDVELTKDA